jgi:hypothetical protein
MRPFAISRLRVVFSQKEIGNTRRRRTVDLLGLRTAWLSLIAAAPAISFELADEFRRLLLAVAGFVVRLPEGFDRTGCRVVGLAAAVVAEAPSNIATIRPEHVR